MIKLIATDMDGTLLRDDKTFSEEFYDLFKLMKEQGIHFVVASGNQYELLQHMFEPIKYEIDYISENGTKVVCNNQVIYTNVIESTKVSAILKILEDYNNCMVVLCGVEHAYILKRFKEHEQFLNNHYKNYCFVDSFEGINDKILKISVSDWDYQVEQTVASIRPQLPVGIKIITSGNVWFDISNQEINKGIGIKILQERLNIDFDECVAFGDMLNDYELLSEVKYGYCMANGHSQLKAIAYEVIASNQDDGVIKKLKEILEKRTT